MRRSADDVLFILARLSCCVHADAGTAVPVRPGLVRCAGRGGGRGSVPGGVAPWLEVGRARFVVAWRPACVSKHPHAPRRPPALMMMITSAPRAGGVQTLGMQRPESVGWGRGDCATGLAFSGRRGHSG